MLQSTDPEILGNKEGSWGHTQISLGRGNRRDSVSGLMVGADGNMKGCIFYLLLYLLISCPPPRALSLNNCFLVQVTQ